MEAWTDLYQEIAQRINDKLPDIAWVDLWHEQIQFLTEELPFPTPAVFIAFNTTSCSDKGLLIQNCEIQVDMYLFYETFSDTYQGSYNQGSAIDYLRTLTKLHSIFHGISGTNFNSMRRIDMKREDSGDAGNLYRISFSCIVEDSSAMAEYEQQEVTETIIDNSSAPIGRQPSIDTAPLFMIETV